MKRVLVTGGYGFLGSAVLEELSKNVASLSELSTFHSSEYDLRVPEQVEALLHDKTPDTIIHLAARVGGIGANQKYPGTFLFENLMMGVQLIEAARKHGVKKFVNIGTICSYPKFTPVPFQESEFWNGYPEETNAPYGLAKKLITVQLDAYRKEFGFQGISLLVVNLYGPKDNFDLESSHVIPAMIRKFHEAVENDYPTVTLWGDGSPSREFLYVDDAARAIRLAAEKYDDPAPINVGSGSEVRMKDLAEAIKKVVGYKGEIIWDTSRPNGQPRRCLDVSRARSAFGFSANVTLPLGIQLTYDWFRDNYKSLPDTLSSKQIANQPVSATEKDS